MLSSILSFVLTSSGSYDCLVLHIEDVTHSFHTDLVNRNHRTVDVFFNEGNMFEVLLLVFCGERKREKTDLHF